MGSWWAMSESIDMQLAVQRLHDHTGPDPIDLKAFRAEVEALAAKATPGPWRCWAQCVVETDEREIAETPYIADAALIAHTPTLVAALGQAVDTIGEQSELIDLLTEVDGFEDAVRQLDQCRREIGIYNADRQEALRRSDRLRAERDVLSAQRESMRQLLHDLLNDCDNWGCGPDPRYRAALGEVAVRNLEPR
jgi:hypothetical protein